MESGAWLDDLDAIEAEARSTPAEALDVRLLEAIEREKRRSIRYPEDIGHDIGMAHAQDIIRREIRRLSPHNREAGE